MSPQKMNWRRSSDNSPIPCTISSTSYNADRCDISRDREKSPKKIFFGYFVKVTAPKALSMFKLDYLRNQKSWNDGGFEVEVKISECSFKN